MQKIMFLALLLSAGAWAQAPSDAFLQTPIASEGWHGFTNYNFMLDAVLTLVLATVLGAAIAYHPKHGQTADTLEEIEAPQTFIMYSVVGAIIGILVVEYGMVVGFVLFGIGGLIRFRTVLRSANLTGRVIYVTLIGLSCGLELPHAAVLATAFGFALIYFLDANVTYRVVIKGLEPEHVAEAATAYRELLEQRGSRILSEKKSPNRGRVSLIFHGPKKVRRSELEELLEAGVHGPIKGSVDWEVD